MFGCKYIFFLIASLGLGGAVTTQASEVIRISKNKRLMAITQGLETELIVGERVCVESKRREKICGEVVKVKSGGAIARMNKPLNSIVPGDKVQVERTAKSPVISSSSIQESKKTFPFLTASLMNWQHQTLITDGVSSVQFNGNSLGFGAGGGVQFRMGLVSWITQGQVLFGTADIGFLKGAVPNFDVDISGQGLGFFGARIDNSILMNLNEGVCWGVGLPLMTTFYFKRDLGAGTTLRNQDFIQLAFVLDFRLKRDRSVFNPKMGFSRNLRQYFISIEYQWFL